MRRVDRHGNISELPELALDRLDEDERWFLRAMLGWIETGNMFHGRFVEVHTARVLGADLPTEGIHSWDLRIPGPPAIPVEVKVTTFGGSYNITKQPSATVWVFVATADKAQRPRAYSYVVVPAAAIANVEQRQSSQRRLFALWPKVTEVDLAAAVRAADAEHCLLVGAAPAAAVGSLPT